jgi:hypothetical protein
MIMDTNLKEGSGWSFSYGSKEFECRSVGLEVIYIL